MRFPLLAMLFSAALAVAPAQSRRPSKTAATTAPNTPNTPGDASTWPLETLRVTGNQNYTAQQILSVAQLRVGQVAGQQEFETARERLVATGAFNRVGYQYAPSKDAKGYDATIEVEEMPQVYPLRFEDLPASDDQLRAWLAQKDPLFAPKIPATKPELDRYARWIGEYLGGHDFHEPVAGKVVPEGMGDLVILFRPAKARPSVARVKFENTGTLPSGMLQTAMFDVAVGLEYTEPRLRLMLDNTIRPLYEARGMIRVAFPKIETEPAKDVEGIVVTVTVNQGPVYNLERVSFVGSETSQSELSKLANLKSGKPVNFDQVKKGQDEIVHSLRREGYLNAKTEVQRDVHDADHTLDLSYVIDPGQQFTLGKVDIVGLDIESEPVIRKMWGLGPGKPFNADYPEYFLSRIKDQNVFENLKNTRAETKINPDHTVDVKLFFNK